MATVTNPQEHPIFVVELRGTLKPGATVECDDEVAATIAPNGILIVEGLPVEDERKTVNRGGGKTAETTSRTPAAETR